MGDLVAGHVQLHQLVHLADLLGQGDQPVVVGHQALQVLEKANGGGEVAQLVPADVQVDQRLEGRDVIRDALDDVVVEQQPLQAVVVGALGGHLDQLVPRQVCKKRQLRFIKL